ncbi:MAG TPA: hypothetical protein VFA38_06035, partial [Nitrospirales bacterium]|nr:hypothetical protein [Nitrospirales bacterium]
DYFRWAEEFARIRDRIQGYEHWEQIEQQMVAPHINQVLQALGQHFRETEAERWTAWRERYVPEFLGLLQIMRGEAAAKSRERLETVVQAIDPLLPDAQRAAPLSQKALWILASTPGVTSVLNGMRTPAYVDDSLSMLSQPPHSNPGAVYAAVPSL